MANFPPPPWSAYHALMEFWLVALYNMPGVRLSRIRETLRRDLSKLVLRAAEGQANMVCGKQQLYTILVDDIEGMDQTLGLWRDKRRSCPREEEE